MEIYWPDSGYRSATYYKVQFRIWKSESDEKAGVKPIKIGTFWSRYGGDWVDHHVDLATPSYLESVWYDWKIIQEQVGLPADHQYMIMHC